MPAEIIHLDIVRMLREAKQYAQDWLTQGPEYAVMRYNKAQSALFRSIVRKELAKLGIAIVAANG